MSVTLLIVTLFYWTLQTIERRNILELEEARAEIITQKKKYDQSQELLDETKKKLSLSREDGKLEGKAEVDSARAIARDLEAQLRAQVNEFKKHREDHASIAGRLASALQTAQVAMAECEAAKAQANGAISEGQTSHSALIQATHRMQQLDQECVALKTEYLMLRTENDTQAGEIRKLMNVSGINGDKLAETYADFKRLKANSQVSHTIFYSLSLSHTIDRTSTRLNSSHRR